LRSGLTSRLTNLAHMVYAVALKIMKAMRRMRNFLALNLLTLAASSVFAQPESTRIAVVDVGRIFHGYKRANGSHRGSTVLWSELEPLKVRSRKLTDELRAWDHALKSGQVAQSDREAFERAIKKNQAELEDIERELKHLQAKRQEEHLRELWRDIRAAVREYAIHHKIDLVLAYGDPPKELIDQPANIQRKKDAIDFGGTIPSFVAPGADITDGVLTLLNQSGGEPRRP